VAITQIGHLCGKVVHLGVDIQVVVAAPVHLTCSAVIPKSL
jgi:hypothetical protein